jgi:esterase/lipase superfamily enzyme
MIAAAAPALRSPEPPESVPSEPAPPPPPPPPTAAEPPEHLAPNVVSVLYGTDRDREGATDALTYGPQRARRLELGEVRVSIPKSHVPGKVEAPGLIDLVMLRGPDPAKHFVIARSPRVMTEQDFVALARSRDQGQEALLFVHGYNNDFTDGLFRTAQLAYDFQIKGPVFYYSWPSRHDIFAYDQDVASADQAEIYFERYLTLIMSQAGVTRLHIIAHSRGNNLVLTALDDMARTPNGLPQNCCGQLLLASPDVDRDYAKNLIPRIAPHFQGVTLYANNNDHALQVSAFKAGNIPRLGQLQEDRWPVLLQGMDSIDASAARLPFFDLNHDTYVEDSTLLSDMESLVARGVRPPNMRSPSLQAVNVSAGRFWELVEP